MNLKFKLTSETITWLGRTLFRIEALIDFGNISKGDKGGFVEVERNVSQDGNAWVSGNALVYGNARVSDDARVCDNARVSDDALVCDDAWVSGNARVLKPVCCATRSDGYTFVVAPDKDGNLVVIAGCRYFTFKQAKDHWTATRGGTQLGDESLQILKHLKSMANIRHGNL